MKYLSASDKIDNSTIDKKINEYIKDLQKDIPKELSTKSSKEI